MKVVDAILQDERKAVSQISVIKAVSQISEIILPAT
jgi:hypothetical protein